MHVLSIEKQSCTCGLDCASCSEHYTSLYFLCRYVPSFIPPGMATKGKEEKKVSEQMKHSSAVSYLVNSCFCDFDFL